MRRLILIVVVLITILGIWNVLSIQNKEIKLTTEKIKIVSEESVVIDIVEKVSPSVVTVGIEQRIINFDPFDIFRQRPQSVQREQDIGSGFIVSKDGLIVTNKHVVDSMGKYNVITHDGKKYEVKNIYRDPTNDIAIVKIDPSEGLGQVLKPVEMGDSSKIKVGQLVVAVGTPLGEFRGSVTKGIVSGIGRGITAGSPFESFAEKLDDVIQTDAAINPGNSGGPLVDSSAQVIGVNTALVSGAENIGFAIPINSIKDALDNFNNTGGFVRPYLGVAYRMVSRDIAILNDLPEGAYVQEVVQGSAAAKAGIKNGDIIIKIDNKKISTEKRGLAGIIASRKVGDTITVVIWSEGNTKDIQVILAPAPNQ